MQPHILDKKSSELWTYWICSAAFGDAHATDDIQLAAVFLASLPLQF
jgi:hypothetical protein